MVIRRVAGRSMLPSLSPGGIIIAFRTQPRTGDIVIAHQGGREVVKRVKSITDKGVYLVGDNLSESTDSRELGTVPKSAILGVMKLRFTPVKATDAPKIKNQKLLVVPYLTALILLAMVLTQLVTFDKFVPILQDYNLNGGQTMTKLTAAVIVISELFALPFLLRLRLSPLARICSAILGFVAAVLWLGLSIVGIAHHAVLSNTGLFGSLLHPRTSLFVITAYAIGLLTLVTASFVILRGPTLFKPLKK